MKAEYCSINNIKLNDRHITIFDHLQTKDQNIFEDHEEAKESRNKAKVKSIKQYTQNKGNEPQVKIYGVWPSKLQLTNYDLKKIEFLVYVDKNIKVSWKSVKRNWEDSWDAKKTVLINYEDKEFNQLYSAIDNKLKLIDWAKIKYAESYKKEVDKVKHNTVNLIKNFIIQLVDKETEELNKLVYIQDYSWEDIRSTLKLYSKHKVNQSKDIIKTDNISVLKNTAFWESQLSIIAESIYSSYSRLWKVNLDSDLKFGSVKNKIRERHNIIKYLIDNQNLDTVESKSYSKSLYNFLKTYSEQKDDTNLECCIAKYNSKNKLKLKELKTYPFEVAFGAKDVLIRIETLLKWNEITSSPKFIKQSSFSHIFGFKITNMSIFYGK